MLRMILMLASFVLVMTIAAAGIAAAADRWEHLSVQAALQSDLAKDKLDPAISFFMKGQKHNKANNPSREYSANKRTSKFRKSAEAACQHAFISALISFQQRAQREDRNAVIDLYSITKNKKFVSSKEYSCLAGGMMVNVALKGKVADIRK